MEFRIKEENKKFKVQVFEKRIFRKNRWVDFVKYSGSNSTFFFSSMELAIEALVYEVKLQTIRNSI